MPKNNIISFFAGFLVVLWFASSYGFLYQKEKNPEHCLAAYDQFGYYSYLPALFIYEDLNFKKTWKDSLQQTRCDIHDTYQFKTLENGNTLNIYHMGLSYLHLPGFLIADQIAKNTTFKRDGMSLPYKIAVRITALVFILLGVYYLRRFLLLFVGDITVAITLIAVFFGSNVIAGFLWGELMPHLYLFALNTVFIYHTWKFVEDRKRRDLIVAAFILGLGTVIRPTNALWGIIPLVMLFNKREPYFGWRPILVFIFTGLIMHLPQIFYWKLFGGHLLLLNLHSESLVLYKPHLLDFLFSFRKGWLLYTPLFFLSIPGWFILKSKNPRLFKALLLFSIVFIYVLSCWETWWYGSGFGARVMIDSYAIWALALALFFENLKSQKTVIIVLSSALLVFFISLNLLQSFQFYKGILPADRISKDHYMKVFGRWDEKYANDKTLLLINRDDLQWDKKITQHDSWASQADYLLVEKPLVEVQDTFYLDQVDEFNAKINIPYYDLLPTDEAKFILEIDYQPLNKRSCFLVVAVEGYDEYYYHYLNLKASDSSLVAAFNMPDIRSSSDVLKFYLWNPKQAQMIFTRYSCKAIFLKR